MKRFVSLLVLFTLIAAACSNGDGNSESAGEDPPTQQQEAEPDDDTEETANPRAQEIAEAGLLKLEDFPSGWREGDSEETDFDLEDVKECSELARLRDLNVARGESLTFTRAEDDSEVENNVNVYEDESTATTVLDAFASSEATECLDAFTAEGIRRVLAEQQGNPFGAGGLDDIEVEIGRTSVDPIGDQVAGWQIEVVLTSEGFEFEFFADAIIVRVGQAVTNITFTSAFTPFFAGDREPLIEAVTSRLERAQRSTA